MKLLGSLRKTSEDAASDVMDVIGMAADRADRILEQALLLSDRTKITTEVVVVAIVSIALVFSMIY